MGLSVVGLISLSQLIPRYYGGQMDAAIEVTRSGSTESVKVFLNVRPNDRGFEFTSQYTV